MGSLLGAIKGFIAGKFSLAKEERRIKLENPYIYFRELPNTFGIGVASVLMDSEIESYKDIVAAILDLCAKKYLNLEYVGDFYKITILNDDISSLLSNEQYIMNAILHHQIQNLDYKKWYQLCVQDGIFLGLFQYRNEKNKFNDKKTVYNKKGHLKFCFFVIAILFFFRLSSMYTFMDYVITFCFCIIGFVFLYVVTYFPYIIFTLFLAFFRIGKQQQNTVYKHILNASLLKTEYGLQELHKLYAFKKFIRDFGAFASKNPEEVILWEYYLSYAQVFGLTKEIMKTGYEKLIKNASFAIDHIENIQLYNIVFHDN